VSAILALRDHNNVVGEDMGAVSTETIPAIERGDVFGRHLERRQNATNANDTAQVSLTASPPDALVSAKLQRAETEAVATAHAERIIAEAQTTARDIIAEAERAAQDLVARAIKIQAEADRALDDARSKAVCIQKRAQAALALAENIAEGRRLIVALSG
jgi:vacuolar-type H+-ATPase subunit H